MARTSPRWANLSNHTVAVLIVIHNGGSLSRRALHSLNAVGCSNERCRMPSPYLSSRSRADEAVSAPAGMLYLSHQMLTVCKDTATGGSLDASLPCNNYAEVQSRKGGCCKTSPYWLSRADAVREEAIPKSRRRPRAQTPADAAAIFLIADIARVLGAA